MNRIIVIALLLLVSCGLISQTTDIETVMEIQAERELADWIESMLYPIVGDNVAIVDMTLRYPSEGLQVFGSTLDTEKSLPGLPVARSSGVMPSEIAGEETYPTIVVKKLVTIYLSKNTSEDMEEFVRQNVTSWVNIKPEKGDKLDVKRVLSLKEEEAAASGNTIIKTQDYRNYIILIGAVLLILILAFMLVFSTRMGKLSNALKEVNIPGLESVLRPHSVAQTTTKQKETKSNEPVTVKLLPQEDIKKDDLNFKFIENLSAKSCGQLLANETSEHAALVLSQLSTSYVSNFFSEFTGNTDLLLRSMIKGKQLTKPEISKLHKKLSTAYQELIEKESLSYDNQSLIAGILNNMPGTSSQELYEKINIIDSSFANLMRKDVFFLDDLAELDSNKIDVIIRSIDRNLLISYLSIASSGVKEKFFNTMTSRNKKIFEDELEIADKLEEDDVKVVKDNMLEAIRQIFALA